LRLQRRGWDSNPRWTKPPTTVFATALFAQAGNEGGEAAEAGQEEVYIPSAGSAVLAAGEERYELRPGVMVRVGSEQRRRILPGDQGIRFIALGGVPGAHAPSPWTELGGPLPVPGP